MIDFNAKLPDTNGYTFLKDGSILNEDQLQSKLNDGSLTQVTVDPNENNFKRSVGMGARQLASTGYGLAGLAGGITGIDSLKNYGLDNAQKQLGIANLYARDTDQIQNVHSVGDAVSFGVNALGQQLPGLVAGVALGGVGGLIGKKVVTSALAGEVDNLVAQQAIKHGSELGFKAGLFAQGTAQSAGSIYPQAVQNNDPNAIADSLVGGVIGGGLNFLGDNALLNTFKNRGVSTGFLSSLGKNVGIDASAQGGAGLAQSVNERLFSNRDLSSPEAIHEYANAFAQGAIGGTAFGAVNARGKTKESSVVENTNPIENSTKTPVDFSLSNSEKFKSLINENPELANIAQSTFSEKGLSDLGVKKENILDIKKELKLNDLNSKDLGGYTVNDILTKDLSNFTPDEISTIKNNVKDIIGNYDDTKLANMKFSKNIEETIDARYKNSLENPNVENQISKINKDEQSQLNESTKQSQEKMAMQEDISPFSEDSLAKLTPEEQLQNHVKGADGENVILMETEDPAVAKNIEEARKDSNIVEKVEDPIANVEKITPEELSQSKEVAIINDKTLNEKVNNNKTLREAHAIDPNAIEKFFNENPKDIKGLTDIAKNIIANKDIVFAENKGKNVVENNPARELNTQEKLQISKVTNQAREQLKNANVNLNVIHSKDSPFLYKDINGYYDPATKTVTLIGDKVNSQAQITSILNHELLHAGVYEMTKGIDRIQYTKEMENLAKNNELNDLANQLSKEFGYDRATSIEEALARFAESGEFRKLVGIDKFINYMTKLINKILGNGDLVTNADIQNYMARAREFVIDDNMASNINKESFAQSHEYVNDMGNMPKDIMFSENFSEKNAKEVSEIVKSFTKGIQAHEDLKTSTELKTFMEKVSDKVNNSIKIVQNKGNRYDAWNTITKNLSSMREMVQKSELAQTLQNVFDASDRHSKALDQQIELNAQILKGKLKAVSDFDNKSINSIMADFALQMGTDKNGKPSGEGIRPSEQQIKDAIANYKDVNGKLIDNKQGAYELYQIRRANADMLVHKTNQSKIQNQINFIERKIESSPNADRSVITKLRNAIYNVNNAKEFATAMTDLQAGKDYNGNVQKLSDHYKEFYKTLEDISQSDTLDPVVQADFTDRMNSIKGYIEDANRLVEVNGFLPKDHSGKYTIQLAVKIPDANGEMQRVVFGVHASDSFLKRNQYKDAFANSIEQLSQKGLIKDPNQIEITSVDRNTETFSNLNADQFINMAERKGLSLTDEQIKSLQSVSETYKLLDRSFKTGVGYSLDFDKTIFRQLRQENQNIGRGVFYNKEVNIIKNSEGWEKDLMMDMQNAKQQKNNTDAISAKLRGMASLWYLGWNASSAMMQVMQMLQAAPSWMGQFSGGTGTAVTMSSLKKAGKYLKDGTTGDKALDQAIKDFTSPLLGAGENELMFNLSKEGEFNRKNSDGKYSWITKSYGAFGKAEELSRLTTFLSSHEVFHNADKYNSRVDMGADFHEFATNNLVKVNGDYSAYNRPKAFQGPVAQTLFQFKQYLVFMNEMFQHMDGKSKAQFFATMAITGGLNGLPFAKNIEDSIDFLLKMFHVPYSIKGSIDSHLKDMGKAMGSDNFATYIQNGIAPPIGVRAGVGDVVPFLGPILDIASGGDVGKSLQSSIGPVGSVTVNTATGLGKVADSAIDLKRAIFNDGSLSLLGSDMTSAIKQLAPNAFKNVVKGGESAYQGFNVNTGGTGAGRKTDLFDSVTQMFGFQTVSAISSNENQNMINEAKGLKKNISSYYKNQYLSAKLSGNNEMATEIISNIREFNRMAKIDKSGYDFNADIGGWNKEARLNSTLDTNVRAIKGTSPSMRKALAEDLNININTNTNNNLTSN